MPLKLKVKVGQITNLSEARYCAGMGAELLGFPVGDQGLTPEQYRQIIEWLAGPEFVLEIDHSRTMDLGFITENYPGNYVQIGRNQLDLLADASIQFIVSIDAADWTSVYGDLMSRQNVKYIEITGSPTASQVRTIASHFPVLVSVQTTDGVSDIQNTSAGISLTGGKEVRPGVQDYGAVADILESLDVD